MKRNADEHIQNGGEKEKWHREIHLSVDLLRVTTLDAYLSVWGPHRGVATPSTQPCRAGTPAGVVAAQGIQLRVRPHLHHLALAGVAGSVGGGGSVHRKSRTFEWCSGGGRTTNEGQGGTQTAFAHFRGHLSPKQFASVENKWQKRTW